MDRKKFLALGTTGIAGSALSIGALDHTQKKIQDKRWQDGVSPWPICLDTATIRPASLEDKVEIAAQAGYDAIEPWDGELADYEEQGGDLEELGSRIQELGLLVPSVIGLWNALSPNDDDFEDSLKGTRNRMRMAKAIGSEHIQTIPNTVGDGYDVKQIAKRYRQIIEIGQDEFGIYPALVFVKFFPLKTLGQAMAVAIDADHPKALIIPDTFHMYIGDGGFKGLKLIRGKSIAIFQFADAPDTKPPGDLADEDRVFPGDGILPLPDILKDLHGIGFEGCVSLELYNPDYYERDLLEVADTGLQKTLDVIKKAGV